MVDTAPINLKTVTCHQARSGLTSVLAVEARRGASGAVQGLAPKRA